MDVSINTTEPSLKVVLGPQDGLQENQEYEYAVSAFNSLADIVSHENGKWQSMGENNC